MKNLNRVLTAVSVLCQISYARVIQVDVSDNADIVIDVNTEHPEPCPHKSDSIPATKQIVTLDEYDVDLEYELHRGFEFGNGKYLNFSNIPYGQAPYGELRWKPPVTPEKYRDEVNEGLDSMRCAQFPAGWFPQAVQFLKDYGEAAKGNFSFEDNWKDEIDPSSYPEFDLRKFDGSEDCLGLDVHVPKNVWRTRNSKKVPVVVFIHGGGYIFGYKEQAGSPLPLFEAAEKNNAGDFIYVSINYRLGAFGFLGGDKFIIDGGTANVGLHDQRFALEWVQKNIGLFGGDKNTVTVMGQSAGASSILHHITSYGGNSSFKPPFQRAILQSPAFFPEGDPYGTQARYDEVLIRASKRNVRQLRDASSTSLLLINSIMNYYVNYGLFKFNPSVDGTYVPDLPGKLLAEGKYHKGIDILLGHTVLDGLLFTPPWLRSDENLEEYLYGLYPPMTEENMTTIHKAKFYKIYPGEKEIFKIDAVRDLLDDVAISCNNYYLTEATLDRAGSYVYRFLFGATPSIHGADLPYLFYPAPQPEGAPEVDAELAKFMQLKFVNFIRTGTPNKAGEYEWPKYERGFNKRQIMKLGGATTLPRKPDYAHELDPMLGYFERCDFWQKAPFRWTDEDWLANTSPARLREQGPRGGHNDL